MNNKKLIRIFIIMTVLVLIFGTLLHFTYEWSGDNPVVGAFSAVNESTWEHLKLAFYPMLFFGIISYFLTRDISHNFIEGMTIGIFVSMLFIVIFFYGYETVLGTDSLILDILDFVLGIVLGEFVFYKVVSMEDSSSVYTKVLCIVTLICLFVCFVIFTFNTPTFEIFRDPVNGDFGI